MIINARRQTLIDFDGVDNIPVSLKLCVTGKKFLQNDDSLLIKKDSYIYDPE